MRAAHIFFLSVTIFGIVVFFFLTFFVEAFSDSTGRTVLGIAALATLALVYYFAISNEEEIIRISQLKTFSERIKGLFGK